MKKILKFSLFVCSSIATITPLFLTSCNSVDTLTQNIINLVKDNFNKQCSELGKAKDINQALKQYKELFNEQQKKEEIIFDQFNFIGQKGLIINNKQIVPSNTSIIDLYEQSKCNITSNYEVIVDDFINDNNYFMYRFQGYVTIQFSTDISEDNLNIKKGDIVQYIYDIQERLYLNLSIENDGNTKLQYSFNKIDTNITPIYGIIKLTLNSEAKTTLSISDMDEVNYCKHNKIFGYYLID